MDFELFSEVANFSTETVNRLAEMLKDSDEAVKEPMTKSFMGLMIDSLCDEFGLDENETWEQLYNAHKFVNETEGDFHTSK